VIMADRRRLSRFLALMLRHQPEKFGLSLDSNGFAPLDQVWEHVIRQFGKDFARADLEAVVAGDQHGKRRYEIDGERIRALYGHSDAPPVEYPTEEPPELLFHGTVSEALPAIRREGLSARRRQYVHMTTNHAIAAEVARRHTENTLILTIRAGDAHRAGVAFYHPEAQHFLAKAIPPEFIDFPERD